MAQLTTRAELIALIDPAEAQRIVADALIAAGGDGPDWDSETIEHVLEPFAPLVKRLLKEEKITDPFNCETGEEFIFWRELE